MKKIIILILILFTLVACKKEEKEIVIPEVEEEVILEEDNLLDLTFMSGTVLYAEISNMLSNPENYLNKSIKLKGLFSTGRDYNNELIFGCVVPDATACCAQGIQFILEDENIIYPNDFPEIGEEIIIEGDFYYEITNEEYLIVRLDNVTMEILAN